MKHLEADENGAIRVEIENANKNHAMIQKTYGFKSHGLVFLDANKEKVLATMDGHLMKPDQIQAELEKVLSAQRAGGSPAS